MIHTVPFLYSILLEQIVCEDDGLLTRGADGDDAEGDARDLCHALEVFACLFGEVAVAADAGDVRLPAWEGLVDRLDLGEDVEARREFIQQNAKDIRFLDI